jgi:2-succinyl-6-hydroxy-2,4-cyclohexadiene-1-carboxylate synthase
MGTGTQPSLWERIHAITSPLLLVAGEHDTKYSAIQREMADLCPTAQMRIISHCGHNVHLERPAEYIETVKPFLVQNR